MVRTSAVLDY